MSFNLGTNAGIAVSGLLLIGAVVVLALTGHCDGNIGASFHVGVR